MIRKAFLKMHWMPAAVFLIGMSSLGLLLWVDRINERQRSDFALLDTLEHIQTLTTTFHLRLEEYLGGDPEAEPDALWHDLEQAELLVSAVLDGGASLTGVPLKPLEDPRLRPGLEDVRGFVTELRDAARERLRARAAAGPDDTSRFNALFRDIIRRIVELELRVEGDKKINQARSRRLIYGILLFWSIVIIGASAGLYSRERKRRSAEQKLVRAHGALLAQAAELKAHRGRLADMVERRTEELTAANERLRLLSSKLLSAQEEERSKISRELHDELGQALTLAKLQVRAIERRLPADEAALREECRTVLANLNGVIENVRRLSRDLSPIILEDLGLTRALRRLADNVAGTHDIRLTVDLADIDELFSRDVRISVYRIVQEALTNIVKHSQAASASIVIRCEDDGGISFSITDDGKGFDVEALSARSAADKGLGLASMRERARILNGALDVRSAPGRGTALIFSFPAGQERECHEALSHHTGG